MGGTETVRTAGSSPIYRPPCPSQRGRVFATSRLSLALWQGRTVNSLLWTRMNSSRRCSELHRQLVSLFHLTERFELTWSFRFGQLDFCGQVSLTSSSTTFPPELVLMLRVACKTSRGNRARESNIVQIFPRTRSFNACRDRVTRDSVRHARAHFKTIF